MLHVRGCVLKTRTHHRGCGGKYNLVMLMLVSRISFGGVCRSSLDVYVFFVIVIEESTAMNS